MSVDRNEAVQETGLLQRINLRDSLRYGGGAWVIGFVLTYVLVTVSGVFEQANWDPASKTEVVTAVFLSSYGTPLVVDETSIRIIPDIAFMDSSVVESGALVVAVLVPATVLYAAGKKIAEEYDSDRSSVASVPLLSGASLAIGFGIATFAATVVFEVPGTSYTQRGLIFGGVLFPTVFGTLGAIRQTGRSISSLRGIAYGTGSFAIAGFAWYALAEMTPFLESRKPVSDIFDLSEPREWVTLFDTFIESQLYGHKSEFSVLYLEEVGETSHRWLSGMPIEVTHRWIPIAILVCAGFLVVSNHTDGPIDELEGALRGGSVVAGYALCVVAVFVTLLAMQIHGSSDVSAALVMRGLRDIFVVGIVFPFSCSALGGAIAAWNKQP